jgi:hypothetical protein
MSDSETNSAKIAENRETIFNIESEVMTNKALVYQSRSMIEENRHMILSNYSAAFVGNRQLANQNTDDIFGNREYILGQHLAKDETEKNYVAAQQNLAKLEFLQHRSKLNSSVLGISEKMEKINQLLVETNEEIMAANKSIVAFNKENIAFNRNLLSGALMPSNASVKGNAKIISKNKKLMKEISNSALSNRSRMQKLVKASLKNSTALINNKNEIADRRDEILENRELMSANRRKILA